MPESCLIAEFRFYQELNDFLPAERRQRSFEYSFRGTPAIKDAIEALGVPHTEVDLVLINGVSVGFGEKLRGGDHVSVYPVFESFDIGSVTHLRQPLRELKFIGDVHLGKLARRLRLLGFDVAYQNPVEDAALVETALAEQRTILTQDRGLLKRRKVTHGYLVRSPDVREQVREVVQRFDLLRRIKPFSRCVCCNGMIRSIAKSDIQDRLPPKTRELHDEFFQCDTCRRVYWKGSHVTRLEAEIHNLVMLGREMPQQAPST
jgi:uncharacterized protein